MGASTPQVVFLLRRHALVSSLILACSAAVPYFTLEDELAEVNYDVTHGNPFRGLFASPGFGNYDESITNIDSSLNFYFVPFNEIVVDDPGAVGELAYDWEPLEIRLNQSAAKSRHAILTFSIHIPDRGLLLPPYLMDSLDLLPIETEDLKVQMTPDYGDPELMVAIERFIEALGNKYDGDNRIAVIHLGLLGFW